jgi:hypothetical protein
VYNDQIKLKGEHEAMESENQSEEQGGQEPSNLVRTQNTTASHLPTHLNKNKHSTNTPNKLDHSATT